MKPGRPEIPVVFISSTSEDLSPYREAARDAALRARFHPEMMESFTVSGARPPLAECQERARAADVTVVLVAHRYGWVPEEQVPEDDKNICWLECEAAIAAGQELLAFIVDNHHAWPAEFRESHRLEEALQAGQSTPGLLASVQRGVSRLKDFKAWLNGRGIRALFTTPEDLRGKISDALHEWRSRQLPLGNRAPATPPAESEEFLLQRVIVEALTRQFVGRDDAVARFDQFLRDHSRGYFLVPGEPGAGKSALAAQLTERYGAIHHFIRQGTTRADVRLIAGSLLTQLRRNSGLPEQPLPEALGERVHRFENLLAQQASPRAPVVVIVDALDELPASPSRDFPFLITEGLPQGVYFLVTSRPDGTCDALTASLKRFQLPFVEFPLQGLATADAERLLLARDPNLTPQQRRRIVDVAGGNPLYLTSVVEAMACDSAFDLERLPPAVEGIFANTLAALDGELDAVFRQVLGLLAVARSPLSLADLSQITGARQRAVDQQVIARIRPFLHHWQAGYSFYHARFADYVRRELLYEDELSDCHGALVGWLTTEEATRGGGANRAADYRTHSLAYHLYHSPSRAQLPSQIDSAFLRGKMQAAGYDVLEDIELLVRVELETGDPQAVTRCAELVEQLRELAGGDLIQATRDRVLGLGAVANPQGKEIRPALPRLAGLDSAAVLVPKFGVGADFVEAVVRDGKLVVGIGDAPGGGLRGAFVARFIASLFVRLTGQSPPLPLYQILNEIDQLICAHPIFEHVTMQCAEVDLARGIATFASAGGPAPARYAARRKCCERLPIQGASLAAGRDARVEHRGYDQRSVEFEPGDVLVLLTDGLTEAHRLDPGRYGDRFLPLVEQHARHPARDIADGIIADWNAHPRDPSYYDDTTLVVIRCGDPVIG